MAGRIKQLTASISAKDKKIHALKQENERLRIAMSILVAPKDDSSVVQSFRFLDLPAELRVTIYELCLVKGTVCPAPRPRYDHRYDGIDPYARPEWSLLQVSRQVREEAAKVLLSENHFILSYVEAEHIFWASPRWIQTFPISLPSLVRRHIKSVSVSIDFRTFFSDPLDIADRGMPVPQSTASDNELNRMSQAHAYIAALLRNWYDMCSPFATAKFLQVDVANAYCSLGCHRYMEYAARAIAQVMLAGHIPDTLEILGTKTSAERTTIKNTIGKRLAESHPEGPTIPNLYSRSVECVRDVDDDRGCVQLHTLDLEDGLDDEEVDVETLIGFF